MLMSGGRRGAQACVNVPAVWIYICFVVGMVKYFDYSI